MHEGELRVATRSVLRPFGEGLSYRRRTNTEGFERLKLTNNDAPSGRRTQAKCHSHPMALLKTRMETNVKVVEVDFP
jgi:hypothetical protein